MSFPVRLVAILFVLAAPALAQVRIDEGIGAREFLIAHDEIHVGRRLVQVNSQTNLAALVKNVKQIEAEQGSEGDLVLYPAGLARNPAHRRLLTRNVAVRLAPGTDPDALARRIGAVSMTRVPYAPDFVLIRAAAAAGALDLAARLKLERGVIDAQPQLARMHAKKFLPDDSFFSSQWHLRNTGQAGGTPGIDVNVTNVWETWRGSNVVIGIVDDGLDVTHTDLAPNFSAALSWDFNGNDSDPSPHIGISCGSLSDPTDCHGTAVAGVAAARGNNGAGVAGAAFEATLAGIRLISTPTEDFQDAAAMSHSNAVIQIKNNSWGAPDCEGATVLNGPGPLMKAAIHDGTQNGRGGKGVIYVWAGGNGKACGEDVNYDGYANLVDVIAVGAVSDQGAQALYSEPGACLVTAAPSSSGFRQAITTTDISNGAGYSSTDYTQTFGGTSSAAPLVSGVIALLLQANPNLSYRDVKEILLRSGRKVQPLDSDWKTNAAGIVHNHKFGGGMVNAQAAINLSTNWAPLGVPSSVTIAETNLGLAIPDHDLTGITRSFAFTNAGFRVENVAVTITAPHARWGDLIVTLTSPNALQSRLAGVHTGDTNSQYDAWTFNSVRHWGEQAFGTWTVTVSDGVAGSTGTLEGVNLTLHGSAPSPMLHLSLTNGAVEAELKVAAPGWHYAIEATGEFGISTNNWSQIGTVTMSTSGITTLTDTNGPAIDHRFYRARLLP